VHLCLFVCFVCVYSNNHWGEWNDSQLQPTIQKLMKGYNRYLRPNFNEGPVEIGMSLDIASIDAISEINMDYTATIFLRQRWRDSRLVFPGNESVSVDGRLVSLLWIPDTFIPDSKRSFLHDVTVENRLIRIFSNGTVLYALRITATIACNMDLTKYPMDRQVCTLQLESWGYNLQDVVFYWTRGNDSVKGLDILRLAQYSVESYYTSVSEAVYETGQYPKLVLHFALRRNVLFFILETYVPSILLVVLSWVSFWISQSSVPARTCIGVTTVLTMTTLMMGARTSLPNANCFIKAIDVYLGICFTFIFGALVEYACAHFYTMQHHTIEDLHRVRETNDTRNNAGALEKVSGQGCGLSSVKDASRRVASVFTVENPHDIDRRARTVFPTAFLFVNILYWLYYLFL
uniref:Gamma-aminobutyric acid receptor subunit pi n=1 Tax=Cyclopterus lumpus TaxID=8103 RepID=A0A8C3AUZ1_CYCLU